jgi:hypothetical protein
MFHGDRKQAAHRMAEARATGDTVGMMIAFAQFDAAAKGRRCIRPGDRVRHITFGDGTVQVVTSSGSGGLNIGVEFDEPRRAKADQVCIRHRTIRSDFLEAL